MDIIIYISKLSMKYKNFKFKEIHLYIFKLLTKTNVLQKITISKKQK